MKAYTITVNGTAYEVEVEEKGGAVAAAPRAETGCCWCCYRYRSDAW